MLVLFRKAHFQANILIVNSGKQLNKLPTLPLIIYSQSDERNRKRVRSVGYGFGRRERGRYLLHYN